MARKGRSSVISFPGRSTKGIPGLTTPVRPRISRPRASDFGTLKRAPNPYKQARLLVKKSIGPATQKNRPY